MRQDVNALLHPAEPADQKDNDPQALPKEMARREKLLAQMDAACARLEQRAQARAAAERAAAEAKGAARNQRAGSAQGPAPKPPPATPSPDDPIHRTDPDARLMRKSQRERDPHSYRCEAVVDTGRSRLIAGQRGSPCASAAGPLEPDLPGIPDSLGTPTPALADCGFAGNLKRLLRLGAGLELAGAG